MSSFIPASLNAILSGVKFWKDSKKESIEQLQNKKVAIENVYKAALATKAYLYDLQVLGKEIDRDKERELSRIWWDAAWAIDQYDQKLYYSARMKALSYADHREWSRI
ncbi:hypothetical protein [Vibrio sp. Isolate30]|uniref:hypothetical protein n=1 Tax=Vibrio sp. Isolate30 TaxID=2908536 RepID=UPI001EFE1396|nr:hypothetical protein [Vibrio sp. Isolate30]MCG9633676.1 hypothetical protein [Vibrio sp. Isolate30]